MKITGVYIRSFLLFICGISGGYVVDRNLNNEIPIFFIILSFAGIALSLAYFKSQSKTNEEEQE